MATCTCMWRANLVLVKLGRNWLEQCTCPDLTRPPKIIDHFRHLKMRSASDQYHKSFWELSLLGRLESVDALFAMLKDLRANSAH